MILQKITTLSKLLHSSDIVTVNVCNQSVTSVEELVGCFSQNEFLLRKKKVQVTFFQNGFFLKISR